MAGVDAHLLGDLRVLALLLVLRINSLLLSLHELSLFDTTHHSILFSDNLIPMIVADLLDGKLLVRFDLDLSRFLESLLLDERDLKYMISRNEQSRYSNVCITSKSSPTHVLALWVSSPSVVHAPFCSSR